MSDVVRNEEWFLEQLDAEKPDVRGILAWFDTLSGEGALEQAQSSAELLQDALVERGLTAEALLILRVRARWQARDPAFRKICGEGILQILGSTPETRALVDNIGLDADIPLDDCFKRLNVLRALAPDVLCYDATWGGGVVRGIDWFYKRVDIDFEKKAQHQMSFAYAGETLTILGSDHLFAMRHNDPDELKQMVSDDPAEVIRICLRSFGPEPIAQIQERLVPSIVADDQWKKFWDGARKELKKDPLVDIPSKRSEPISLLSKEKGYDEDWFGALAKDRGMKSILEGIDEFMSQGEPDQLSEEFKDVLKDRLAFVAKGAERKHPDWEARAYMAAHDMALSGEGLDVAGYFEKHLEPRQIVIVTSALPAREVKRFLVQLREHDRERLLTALLEVLPLLEMTAVNEAMDLLIEEGKEAECATIMRDLTVETQTADVELLYWLMRHPEYLQKWSLGGPPELALWCLRALNIDHSGEKLKTQNQLRGRFEQTEWLHEVLDSMDDKQRRELLRGVKEAGAWSTMERRSVLGKIIKHRPELGEELVEKADETSEAQARGPVTSMRSYHQRQAQLEKIVRVEIPEVAREIGVARSYGDLRENFEYKAAKDKQALLMRRRGELEAMLQKVVPTAFEGIPADRVMPGTGVILEHGDGEQETYHILGVWDRDEDLGIISCDSKLAQALDGRAAGDEVVIPGEDGERTCTIVAVNELPETVRSWINE